MAIRAVAMDSKGDLAVAGSTSSPVWPDPSPLDDTDGFVALLKMLAQVSTLREHFLKLGAQVLVTVRRIVVRLPQAFPYRDSFRRLALSLGAQTG